MPSAVTPSFKSKFSALGRSKRSSSTDENANPRNKSTPRRSTTQAPARTPLAPLHPQPPAVTTSKAERGPKGVTTACASSNTEDKPASMKKTFSTMFSNIIRRSSSSRKDVALVRGEDGKFLPPMHLANRKGSRYAEPKPTFPAPVNGGLSARHAPVAQPETARTWGEKAAKEVAPVRGQAKVRGLKPLRLVNKVLSEGHPVANLVPGCREVEVNQKVVDDEETNERVVIVEMKIARNANPSVAHVKQAAGAGRNVAPVKQAANTFNQNYPLKRRSVPYKSVTASPQIREVSKSSNVAVPEVHPVKVNEHAKRRQHLDRDSTGSEKQYEHAAKERLLHGEEVTGSVGCALVSTSLEIDTSSASSASTSCASTPTPSPVKPASKPMLTGLPRRKTSTSTKGANGPQIPKVAASKLRGPVDGQERVRSKKNFRTSISSLFAKSTANAKLAVVPAESVVPPVTVSNISLGKGSENTTEVKDEKVLGGNKREEDSEHAAKVPVEDVGTLQMPSESDENNKAGEITPSSDVAQSAEAVKTNSATPPSHVRSLLQRFQHIIATPQPPSPNTPNTFIRGSRTPSPPTAGSPAVYSLRPAIPAHLATKTVANPDIQLELDFLRTTSVAARSRTVLERAKMFRAGGSGSGSDGSGSEESGESAPSTPGGVWRGLRTPVMSSPGSDTDSSVNESSPESKLSLRAMAIAHRVRNLKRE